MASLARLGIRPYKHVWALYHEKQKLVEKMTSLDLFAKKAVQSMQRRKCLVAILAINNDSFFALLFLWIDPIKVVGKNVFLFKRSP